MLLPSSVVTLEAPQCRPRIKIATALGICSLADDMAIILPTAAVIPNGTVCVFISGALRRKEGALHAAIIRPVGATGLEEVAFYTRTKGAWQNHTARLTGAFDRILGRRLVGLRTGFALKLTARTYLPPDPAQSGVSYKSKVQPETEEQRVKRIPMAVEECMILVVKVYIPFIFLVTFQICC